MTDPASRRATQPQLERRRVYIYGAGGHAKVVIDALQQQGIHDIRVFSSDLAHVGQPILGLIIEDEQLICQLPAIQVHIAIGSQAVRAKLSQACLSAKQQLTTIIYPGTTLPTSARIQDGCFIARGAIIGPDTALGQSVIINHGAIVDHDVHVGDWSHIAPNATLGGCVHVGSGCLIGSGAVVLPGCKIGDHATVGASAVVTKDIPARTTVVGSPARPLTLKSSSIA